MSPSSAHRPDRLASARWVADRHAAVLTQALASWQSLPAVPELKSIESDPALRQLTDQILFRFMKLQDALGERLIPATLGMLAAMAGADAMCAAYLRWAARLPRSS